MLDFRNASRWLRGARPILTGFLLLSLFLIAAGCKKTKPITIGAKTSTEQTILGEIMAQHLEKRLNQPVARRFNMGGTALVHEALISGEIDAYPEYTGVAQAAILKINVIPDTQAVFDRVREVYKSNLRLDWLDPLGFESPAGMVVRNEDATKLGITEISGAEKKTDGWALGITYEFEQRPDGLAALNRTYHLISATSPRSMDLTHLYTALEKRQVSMIPANATDGLLDPAKFKLLRDDRIAFPPYQASIVTRTESEERVPDLRRFLSELSGKISQQAMRDMNRAVDVQNRSAHDVAAQFLESAGLK